MDEQKQRKSNAGRPTVVTSEVLAKLKAGVLMGFNEEEACVYANIHPATLYREKARNKKLCEDIELWKKNPLLKAKATLYKDLSNPKTAKWYVERRAKDEFSTKQEVELTGNADKPLFYIPDNGRDAK